MASADGSRVPVPVMGSVLEARLCLLCHISSKNTALMGCPGFNTKRNNKTIRRSCGLKLRSHV